MSGSSPYRRATKAPNAPTGGIYSNVTMISVPCLSGAGLKRTEPALSISEPGLDSHARYSLGVSLTMAASHSAVVPAGDLATQCDSVGEVSLTEIRWRAKKGKFSRRRQKRNRSSGLRLMVTHLMTRRARFFSRAMPLLRTGLVVAKESSFILPA